LTGFNVLELAMDEISYRLYENRSGLLRVSTEGMFPRRAWE
jgi:hypothetical protein